MNPKLRDLLVTIFVLVGVLLAVFGYFWFTGRSFQKNTWVVSVYFKDVAGLRAGDRVDVFGVTKGKVAELKLLDNGVLVKLVLEKDVKLTRDTRFAIRSLSYLGSDRYLMVTPGTGAAATDTTVFQGSTEVLDLEAALLRLDELLRQINPEDLTEEMRRTKDELISILDRRLRALDSGFVLTSRNMQQLSTILDSLSGMLEGESTARKILTSPELYEELLTATRQLKNLIDDIKSHPERYFRLRLW